MMGVVGSVAHSFDNCLSSEDSYYPTPTKFKHSSTYSISVEDLYVVE